MPGVDRTNFPQQMFTDGDESTVKKLSVRKSKHVPNGMLLLKRTRTVTIQQLPLTAHAKGVRPEK